LGKNRSPDEHERGRSINGSREGDPPRPHGKGTMVVDLEGLYGEGIVIIVVEIRKVKKKTVY